MPYSRVLRAEGEEDARLPAGNKKAQRKAEKKAQREAYRQVTLPHTSTAASLPLPHTFYRAVPHPLSLSPLPSAQFVLQQDELKRRKEAARLEASQRRDEEHDAAEAADAAALHLAAADAQRRAEEELAEWETAFTVEDAGEMEGETDPTTDEQSVEELVHWVVARKAVLVDEVALRWGLSTAEAKERMRALEENGRLKGVWDERGRWLELREEEWEAVRRWLADSGRVGVRELTAAVNRLVDCRERSGEDEGNDGAEDVYDEKDGT